MANPPTGLTTWQVLRLLWHLPSFVKLYWRLFKDHRVPLRAKVVLVGAVLYFVVPFDLLPDFFSPLFGWLDDLVVLLFAARWFIALCPPDVVQEQVREIGEELRVKNEE